MRNGSVPKVNPEVALAVWEAEDGRCEACGRPMDRTWAKFARVDDTRARTAENLHLLCVDCKARRPDVLRQLVLSEAVAAQVVGQLGPEQTEQATRWLRTVLRRYGVLVWVGRDARAYWLPGIGTFRVELHADGTAAVVGVDRLVAQPELKVRPQARTRGLPRPDRRPLAASVPPGATTSERPQPGRAQPSDAAAAAPRRR